MFYNIPCLLEIMKGGIKMAGILSVTLLICVFIGQGSWLLKIREVKLNEYRQSVTFNLSLTIEEFLREESINPIYTFSCGLAADGKTFIWSKGNDTIEISTFRNFALMSKLVFYDHLYLNKYLNLQLINSLYKQKLLEKGIEESPILLVRENASRRTLMTSDSLATIPNKLFTYPINVGYECSHQILAAFPEPFIFRSMLWHLLWEGVFLSGFVLGLICLWRMMSLTWQSAKVQTMGIAHLEHELKKPLAAMISAIHGIVGRENRMLTQTQELKLELIRARLLKLADVTDTMLTALDASGVKIHRAVVDLPREMELVKEMFSILRPDASLIVRIEEGCEKPLLDPVYFNYLVMNLVDNGMKYAGDHPEVSVSFGREGGNWLLTVTDNGIGMPDRELKRIFRQFYRGKDSRVTSKTGFGLGLAFVKKVVVAYHGHIRVESKVGEGSRFVVALKATEE